MTNEEPGASTPTDAETAPETDTPQNNDTQTFANPASTRDELWQVQFEPNAAREVGARHLGRLIYSSPPDWSHYVFHENDPKA